jgi:hypothetical protein
MPRRSWGRTDSILGASVTELAQAPPRRFVLRRAELETDRGLTRRIMSSNTTAAVRASGSARRSRTRHAASPLAGRRRTQSCADLVVLFATGKVEDQRRRRSRSQPDTPTTLVLVAEPIVADDCPANGRSEQHVGARLGPNSNQFPLPANGAASGGSRARQREPSDDPTGRGSAIHRIDARQLGRPA